MSVYDKIKSDSGFYVGDPCYALSDEIYHGVWGSGGYKDGVIEVPETGLRFVVSGTHGGDGCYCDNASHIYPVDSGCIAAIPLELTEKEGDGWIINDAGILEFFAYDGVYEITPPGSIFPVIIDTRPEEFDDDADNSNDES